MTHRPKIESEASIVEGKSKFYNTYREGKASKGDKTALGVIVGLLALVLVAIFAAGGA